MSLRLLKVRPKSKFLTIFQRCTDEEEAKFRSLTKTIKAAAEKKLPVKTTKLAYVDNYVKPPRNVMKKQTAYGTDRLAIATPAARVSTLNGVGANMAKVGDTRLRIAASIRDTVPARKFFLCLFVFFFVEQFFLFSKKSVRTKIERKAFLKSSSSSFLFKNFLGKGSRSYEDDPEWFPSDWYTRNGRPKVEKKKPQKSIDQIRYDRAKKKEKQRNRKHVKAVVAKDHPYSLNSSENSVSSSNSNRPIIKYESLFNR